MTDPGGRIRAATDPEVYRDQKVAEASEDFPDGTCVRYLMRSGVFGRVVGDPVYDEYLYQTFVMVAIENDPSPEPAKRPRRRIIRTLAVDELHKGDYCEDVNGN